MILEFAVQNYRSIKEEQVLSLLADSGKKKKDNVAYIGDEFRVVKSAVIYGPNASGKTNLIRAFFTFINFIKNSTDLKKGDPIPAYDPFRLDLQWAGLPSSFKLDFLLGSIQYTYEVSINRDAVLEEKLLFYPNGPEKKGGLLFARSKGSEKVQLGDQFLDKSVSRHILQNRLFLSEVGGTSPNEQLGKLYLYFKEIEFGNAFNEININRLIRNMQRELSEERNTLLLDRISRLIRIADTKIERINTTKVNNEEIKFPENFPEKFKEEILSQEHYRTTFHHRAYRNGQDFGVVEFDLEDESAGTQVLFALGGMLLEKLLEGGVVIFDEFDNSLHPKLSKFLVSLFHHPLANPCQAQLIFATHETTLLDKDLFRKDQIWLIEKNQKGETELFTTSDFEGIREDVPFEKWYLEGKFGGLPNIKELEFIFSNETEPEETQKASA